VVVHVPATISWDAVAPLAEAGAIVEAEWIRLLEQQVSRGDAAAAVPREEIRRVRASSACPGATDFPSNGGDPAHRRVVTVQRRVPSRVWPTQRSPPGARVRWSPHRLFMTVGRWCVTDTGAFLTVRVSHTEPLRPTMCFRS